MPSDRGHETTSATARIRQAAVEDVTPLAGLMQQAVVLQQQFAGYYTLQADVDWTAHVRG
jgi:hypothetical protein